MTGFGATVWRPGCHAIAFGCTVWLGAAGTALAQIDVDLAAVRARYDSIERFASGATANTEFGTLVGARGTMWWNAGPWGVGLGLSHLVGDIRYRGRTQIGFPIRTTTRLELQEVAVAGRWRLTDADFPGVTITAAAGMRRIDRRIAASVFSTPLSEVLRWRFAQAGLRMSWSFGSGWIAGAEARVEQGTGARLDVDFHGVADPLQLTPGRGRGTRVAIEIGKYIAPGVALRLRASHSRQRYGASAWESYLRNGQPAGQARYPGSTQRLDEIQLVLDWEL